VRGGGFRTRQAGDAKFNFARRTIANSVTTPLELSFQAIDLRRQEISLDFSETGLGILRRKESLDILI